MAVPIATINDSKGVPSILTHNLESNYDCSSASADLPELISELQQLQAQHPLSDDQQQEVNRLENQIRFIRNKCDIPHEQS